MNAPDIGFLRHRRYCLQCHSGLEKTGDLQSKEEIKHPEDHKADPEKLKIDNENMQIHSIAENAGISKQEINDNKKLIKNAVGLTLLGLRPVASMRRVIIN